MFPGQCGNTAFFFKSQPDQFHFEFRGIVFPGKSFFSAHEVSTCKISGCLSYRILDSGPDGTQTTLTIKHARFILNAELSKLDYRNNRGLDRALIRSLSQGNWLTLKQNILLTGATGSGKTFLACALGHNACRQGYKVYYYRLKALMEQCYQGHADGRYSKLLTRLNNSDLLLLDDWGLEPLSSEQRSDLLEIVDLMYQRGSIIVVSQLPVENWYKMIGDSTHADAILDRLVHGSIKIELKGESMRKIQSPLTEGDQ